MQFPRIRPFRLFLLNPEIRREGWMPMEFLRLRDRLLYRL
jgi:hypothetical protein